MNYIEEVADKIEELYQSGKYDADFRKKLIVNSVTEVDRRAREEERKKMREEEDNYNENTLNA